MKIVIDKSTEAILGVHMIGSEVTELLPELTLAQRLGVPLKNFEMNIHAHPTLSEVILEAVHDLKGEAIHI